MPHLIKIVKGTRGLICKERSFSDFKIKIHILERSKVLRFNVNNLGLTSEEDKEVLRIALAAAYKAVNTVYLITCDTDFFNNFSQKLFKRRYPTEAKKIRILRPSNFMKELDAMICLSII